jgi:hypothetical protein
MLALFFVDVTIEVEKNAARLKIKMALTSRAV